MSINHQPEWERRIRHAASHPKIGKQIGEDFIACLSELTNLREQICAAHETFNRIRELAGAGPNGPMPAEHYVSLALQQKEAGAAVMREAFEKLRPMLKQTAAQLARAGAHEMVTGYVAVFDATNAGRELLAEVESLRRKVAAADGLRSVVVEAAKETMVIAGGDDGGFGVQDSLQPTPLAGRARDALAVWEEASK